MKSISKRKKKRQREKEEKRKREKKREERELELESRVQYKQNKSTSCNVPFQHGKDFQMLQRCQLTPQHVVLGADTNVLSDFVCFSGDVVTTDVHRTPVAAG